MQTEKSSASGAFPSMIGCAHQMNRREKKPRPEMPVRKLIERIRRRIAKAFTPKASFEEIQKKSEIFLYAGDVPNHARYRQFVGLSLRQSDKRHIRHDVGSPIPLRDGCVDVYQSEDVFEHIEPGRLPAIINEIHRVLKVGGVLRISMPDYRCDLLRDRTIKDDDGRFLFDPAGGGEFVNGEVVGGGHVWFPVYESVKDILDDTGFDEIVFHHYYAADGEPVTRTIDYSIGHVQRTPDHDPRVQDPYRPLSIVVDCRKTAN